MIELVALIVLFLAIRAMRRASRELTRPIIVHVHVHMSDDDPDPGEELPEDKTKHMDNVVPLQPRKVA